MFGCLVFASASSLIPRSIFRKFRTPGASGWSYLRTSLNFLVGPNGQVYLRGRYIDGLLFLFLLLLTGANQGPLGRPDSPFRSGVQGAKFLAFCALSPWVCASRFGWLRYSWILSEYLKSSVSLAPATSASHGYQASMFSPLWGEGGGAPCSSFALLPPLFSHHI